MVSRASRGGFKRGLQRHEEDGARADGERAATKIMNGQQNSDGSKCPCRVAWCVKYSEQSVISGLDDDGIVSS